MKTINLIILSSALLLLWACDKDDDAKSSASNDYLIFGHFHGMCMGEWCVETFKLTDTKLHEDTLDQYVAGDYAFVPLDHAKFLEVQDLVDYFPQELWSSDETQFGCADCYDQGGFFVQYAQDGIVKSWRIDKTQNDVPAYLHPFMDQVQEKIELLQE